MARGASYRAPIPTKLQAIIYWLPPPSSLTTCGRPALPQASRLRSTGMATVGASYRHRSSPAPAVHFSAVRLRWRTATYGRSANSSRTPGADHAGSTLTVDGKSFPFPPLSPAAQELIVAGGAENLVASRFRRGSAGE